MNNLQLSFELHPIFLLHISFLLKLFLKILNPIRVICIKLVCIISRLKDLHFQAFGFIDELIILCDKFIHTGKLHGLLNIVVFHPELFNFVVFLAD